MNLKLLMPGLRWQHRCWPTLLLLGLLAGQQALAQTNTRPVRLDFSSFKLITDRNSFSPTRTPSRPMRYETPRTQAPTYSRSDYFSLVGTMEYEKGPFAFSMAPARNIASRSGWAIPTPSPATPSPISRRIRSGWCMRPTSSI